ncbi:MAG: response regulator [Taibaiella sp.]|nr:response regulator [Taibaiella sp.]
MANTNRGIIFLVDDEPIQNEMLKDYLSERFNYDIKTFDNGEAAINAMGQKPDIVVLDFHLSAHDANAKNGVEVLKELKSSFPESNVIMLSGQDKLEVAVDSMKYGAYDYVVKGETAFPRMENILNNIGHLRSARRMNKAYKNTITMLALVIGVIVLISFYLMFFTSAYSH